MLNHAGTVAGSVINAFAVNEASIVHALSGYMSCNVTEKLEVTRRANVSVEGTLSLKGAVEATRRLVCHPKGSVLLTETLNTSQRHGTMCHGGVRLTGSSRMIRRKSAIAHAQLRLESRAAAYVRRAASGLGEISLSAIIVHARRRQIAGGTATINFTHKVNLRALSPIYAKSKMVLDESAVPVRRVGLPSHGITKMSGVIGATARRCFTSVSPIAFSQTIKLPHVHMVPNEPYRELFIHREMRALTIPIQQRSMQIVSDERSMNVDHRHEDMFIFRHRGRL